MVHSDNLREGPAGRSPKQPWSGIVVVRYREDGEQEFFVVGDDPVRLFIVDERAPNDRVYEWLSRDDGDVVRKVIGDGPIGNRNDSRHAAIAHNITAMMEGRPRLAVVPPEDQRGDRGDGSTHAGVSMNQPPPVERD